MKTRMKKTDKLIVTHSKALLNKYGKGRGAILDAMRQLIKSDAGKGIQAVLVFVDEANKSIPGFKPVKDASDPAQHKKAIDNLYRYYKPDYLLILGSRDVIPHVPMQNLADKEDRFVNSDLPYACEEPYSIAPGDFIAPSRVVGRLPDITGGTDYRYLVRLLNYAAKAKPISIQPDEDYFAICVPAWKNSAVDGLRLMVHDYDDLKLCPPQSPHAYSANDLKPRIHFFNCHGNKNKPEFYGQHGNNFPMALSSHVINGKIKPGTVVAAECCYGADLYDPSPSTELPICNTYLINGALCFMGSTTVAYGAATGQGQADLLTQYFVQYLLQGASAGRAFLQARLDFMHQRLAQKDPADLKTMSQFLLLGDPSVQLVESPSHAELSKILNKRELQQAAAHRRSNRRIVMHGHSLAVKTSAFLPKHIPGKRPAAVEAHIRRIAKHYKLDTYERTTFSYGNRKASALKQSENKPAMHCHHLVKSRKAVIGGSARMLTELLVIQEAGGEITDVRHYQAR
ncbi:MAG TPA: hypothetical protein VNZ86_07100 [Bacteroidia bacterium]|jgi:hypothetical protein|nr:hypothetical protein [Bacteroidia bacterium]